MSANLTEVKNKLHAIRMASPEKSLEESQLFDETFEFMGKVTTDFNNLYKTNGSLITQNNDLAKELKTTKTQLEMYRNLYNETLDNRRFEAAKEFVTYMSGRTDDDDAVEMAVRLADRLLCGLEKIPRPVNI